MKYTILKKNLLKKSLLYTILDKEVIDRYSLDIFALATKISKSCTDIIQFRFKNISDRLTLDISLKLSGIIHKYKKIFIVNDRVDIAYLSNADGLHLGKDDIDISQARKILGKEKIIGKTVHSKEELVRFSKEDTDYLSIGPVFKTEMKQSLKPLGTIKLKNWIKLINNKPLFAIGGINLDNLNPLVKIGISKICVCRAIILSNDILNTVKEFKRCLRQV
ncbi:MAG: thiamine phosphate synthase [Candidatus Omnitrophica bacterium]|nr:thiamine phosphate synthase [Candidatus Omnitrophota bacterium]MCM8826140.1 thiamine phosphate synthase [Candidatus Omnitrophota bacterium]